MLACPNDALEPDETDFDRFQEGLARVTAVFLEEFEPEDVLYINFLTDITIFCDCWGLSKPSLVPDIGIMAGRNAEKRGTAQSPAPRQW